MRSLRDSWAIAEGTLTVRNDLECLLYASRPATIKFLASPFYMNCSHLLCSLAAVMKHFEDIHEDQFDFHSYCIRKVTLRAYCNVLDWEDNLWMQPYYRRAAEGTIRLYLKIHDDPTITAAFKEPDYSGMSAAEKKKAKAIARKKKKQAEKKAAEAPEGAADGEDEEKELLLKDALDECRKLSAILSKHAANEVSTWILQYDVAIRRGKVLMAMQVSDNATNAKVHLSCSLYRKLTFFVF